MARPKKNPADPMAEPPVQSLQGVKPPPMQSLMVPDGDPVFTLKDLSSLEAIAQTATPEEFQKASALYFRQLLIRGLANVPVPKTIKEIQAIADMIRKSEGVDGKGTPMGGGLVGVRQIVRGRATREEAVMEAETVTLSGKDPNAPEQGDTLLESMPILDDPDEEFEV
jgi:hypothetical protein